MTAEQIVAAARKRGKTKEIVLDGDIKLVVRELVPRERRELDNLLFAKTSDGKHVLVDEAGTESATGEYFKLNEGVNLVREWLRATMTPADALEGIMSDDVPDSVRDEIFAAARSINGYTVKEAAKN